MCFFIHLKISNNQIHQNQTKDFSYQTKKNSLLKVRSLYIKMLRFYDFLGCTIPSATDNQALGPPAT
jgi:hypothetical protein